MLFRSKLDEAATEWLTTKGYDKLYGARPMGRLIQEKIKQPLAEELLFGKLEGFTVALGVMEFQFIGGSMGSVVGEKLTRLIEQATRERLPVIIVCASGGARMQEGMLSLMQMAKISGALERHREARLLYIPILTHPTTGGVTASFAMLGDIIIAEPKATVAFTGGRVIEQTLREKLPENYQTSEYSFAHGFVDLIVPRTQLKKTLAGLISLHQPQPFLVNSEFPAHDASDSHHAVPAPTHAFKLSP